MMGKETVSLLGSLTFCFFTHYHSCTNKAKPIC